MKLFGSNRSPYVRKVRIVLAEKAIACEQVVVPAADPQVGAVNPLSKVPALLRDDGRPLYDSVVIVEYLDGLKPAPKLIPDAFEARIEVRRWEALADGLMDAIVQISHEGRVEGPQRKGADFFARHQKKVDGGLAQMEKDLGERTYCHGDGLTLADIATGTALGYLDNMPPTFNWRQDHPRLAKLYDRLNARPSFKLD